VSHVDSVRGADKYECSVIRRNPIRKPRVDLHRVARRTPRPCRRPSGANVVSTQPESSDSGGDEDGQAEEDPEIALSAWGP
jgi:hypothetical protein